jgi:hypothetical protein
MAKTRDGITSAVAMAMASATVVAMEEENGRQDLPLCVVVVIIIIGIGINGTDNTLLMTTSMSTYEDKRACTITYHSIKKVHDMPTILLVTLRCRSGATAHNMD